MASEVRGLLLHFVTNIYGPALRDTKYLPVIADQERVGMWVLTLRTWLCV
jgi:hypothetical protein